MDISKLTRNAGVVLSTLKEINNTVVATKNTKIYIPARFSERNLASLGSETYIIGIYAIVVEDKYYAVSVVNAMIKIEPTTYKFVNINDEDYIEFIFEPGSTVISNLNLVKTDTLTYRIYDEIISKGNIPWYLGYLELGSIFDTAKKHAGTNIGDNRETTELIISLIARDKKDRTKYYRTTVKSIDDVEKVPPAYISMRSVIYAATNTLNKIAGSYMESGIVSALVSPSTREEHVESLLKR